MECSSLSSSAAAAGGRREQALEPEQQQLQQHQMKEDSFVDDAVENSDEGPSYPPQSPHRRCNPNPIHRFLTRTRDLASHLTRSEISGSLGDLGTLIPLLVALARQRSVLLAPSLFFAGLSNVITGYKWDVPMCVQPMKSIAAVALSEGLRRETVTAAGILTGGMIFVIGITNFIEVVNVIVPPNVVSGIQIGVGLRLASKGIRWVADLTWAGTWDCIALALVCSLLCLYWLRETPTSANDERQQQRVVEGTCLRHSFDLLTCGLRPAPGQPHPVGIYLFLIGSVFAAIELATTTNADGQYDLPLHLFGAPVAVWAMDTVTPQDWRIGFFEGAVPQIPLTTLNSVISVCALAHSLYPEKRVPDRDPRKTDAVIGRRECSVSVGLMNLAFCPFGAMPNCHGAGGLAGQHRLGARYGTSVVFLGVCKILLAVFFGGSALTLLDAVPTSVLGVMLAIAGQELATTGFTLLLSSVEKEHDDNEQAEAEVEAAAVSEEDLGRSEGEGEGRRRRMRLPLRLPRRRRRPKKMMLRQSTVVATITAMVTVALGKTSYGALSGWVAHMVYGDGTADLVCWVRRRWSARRCCLRQGRQTGGGIGGTVSSSRGISSSLGDSSVGAASSEGSIRGIGGSADNGENV